VRRRSNINLFFREEAKKEKGVNEPCLFPNGSSNLNPKMKTQGVYLLQYLSSISEAFFAGNNVRKN